MVYTRSTLKQLQQNVMTRSQRTPNTQYFSLRNSPHRRSHKKAKYVHEVPSPLKTPIFPQMHTLITSAPIQTHMEHQSVLSPLQPLRLEYPDSDEEDQSDEKTVSDEDQTDSDYNPNYWFEMECQSVPTLPQMSPINSPASTVSTIPPIETEEPSGLILKLKIPKSNPSPFPDIDFDEASAAWKCNKRKGANGTYVYTCGKITQSGNPCKYPVHDKIGIYSGCKRHYMWEEKEHKYAF
jgi:hypothetical protein